MSNPASGSGFRLAGVMGWPVAHSRSPLIHNHWLAEYGIAGAYVPFAIRPDDLERALRALSALGIAGVNLTLPHKVLAIDLVDRIDASAQSIGAANLIVVAPDGTLEGRNTDAFGFMASLRDAVPTFDATRGPAIVLGAGGAARAIVHGLQAAGATDIRIVNRTRDRADELAARFGSGVSTHEWTSREAILADAALVVQTTSLGMKGEAALDLRLDHLRRDAVIADIVYTPLRTPLLAAAKDRGHPIVEGLGMLLHQARPSFAAWFGPMPAITPSLRAMVEASVSA